MLRLTVGLIVVGALCVGSALALAAESPVAQKLKQQQEEAAKRSAEEHRQCMEKHGQNCPTRLRDAKKR